MKHLAIERLKTAIREEYPPGQVTIRTYDARTLLALLDADQDAADDRADDQEDDWAQPIA